MSRPSWTAVDDHNNGNCGSFCPICEIEEDTE